MNKTFEEILEELLQARDNNPEADLNVLFAEKAKELGLENEKETLNLIKETGDAISDYCESTAILQEAKDQGYTRAEWLSTKLEEATKTCENDEKEAIFAAIANGMHVSSEMLTTDSHDAETSKSTMTEQQKVEEQ